MMKGLTLSILTLVTSISAFAVEVYFPEERIDNFACTISRSIKEAYPDESRRDLRKGILKALREDINP